MLLQTVVDIPHSTFELKPTDTMLFVGSCFADNIGRRFIDNRFRATVNPYGVMYNPASVMHTVRRAVADGTVADSGVDFAVFTLGTNHVYILNETGEIVDNCQKRPQRLFTEKNLTIEECVECLTEAIRLLRQLNKDTKIILTVSPIRYAKYGFHESQLAKSALLIAADTIAAQENVAYFPAYEIMNDELRDYRFYKPDMLHPTEQAVDYIFERFKETFFSKEATCFIEEWQPIRRALGHRPLNPDSKEYLSFIEQAREREKGFLEKWLNVKQQ
ncbi:MAG: GSCFA domain-containing protein [Prevotellaceae bacterium]|nr:GSCFA domain-containing protein [Prevotellaceae bacterium]MDO4931480.1 GSCFA domain-containing protein [Prevotellaceae bacterium]